MAGENLATYVRGRTLDKLGIDQLSVSELTQWVNEGHGVHGFKSPQIGKSNRRVFVPLAPEGLALIAPPVTESVTASVMASVMAPRIESGKINGG